MEALKPFTFNHPDVVIESRVNLEKLSTMRLKACGTLIRVASKEGLVELVKSLSKQKINYRMLGQGANQILPINSNIPYIKLAFPFDKNYLNEVHDLYELPASISLALLSNHAIKFGLQGWEVFTGIPASLGGAIVMNAGTNLGEIGKLVKSVEIISKKGDFREIEMDPNSFSYRHNNFLADGDIIISAKLIHLGVNKEISEKIKKYLDYRHSTQPLKEFTCGCIFKNYLIKKGEKELSCLAGKYIDIMGLKGFSYKGIQVSPIHGNFMVNRGGADSESVFGAIKKIKEELRLHFGIEFETEVKI